MAKSFVLKALRIFGQEEILKLSKSALVKPVAMKKAAGEDLIVWSDAPERDEHATPAEEKNAKVLPFKKHLADMTPDPHQARPTDSVEVSTLHSTEFMLWNRELIKEAGSSVPKKEAAKEYARSTEMYVVKTSTLEGKEKIRFASTNGVLVNKKQA